MDGRVNGLSEPVAFAEDLHGHSELFGDDPRFTGWDSPEWRAYLAVEAELKERIAGGTSELLALVGKLGDAVNDLAGSERTWGIRFGVAAEQFRQIVTRGAE